MANAAVAPRSAFHPEKNFNTLRGRTVRIAQAHPDFIYYAVSGGLKVLANAADARDGAQADRSYFGMLRNAGDNPYIAAPGAQLQTRLRRAAGVSAGIEKRLIVVSESRAGRGIFHLKTDGGIGYGMPLAFAAKNTRFNGAFEYYLEGERKRFVLKIRLSVAGGVFVGDKSLGAGRSGAIATRGEQQQSAREHNTSRRHYACVSHITSDVVMSRTNSRAHVPPATL